MSSFTLFIALLATTSFAAFAFGTLMLFLTVYFGGHVEEKGTLKQLFVVTLVSLLVSGVSWPLFYKLESENPIHVYETEVVYFWGERDNIRFTGQYKPRINHNNCIVYGNDTISGVCSIVILNDSIIGD